MENKTASKHAPISALIAVAIIFTAAIAGTIVYYNGIVNERDTKIATLNAQVASLNSTVNNLNLPNLVTALGIHEKNNVTYNVHGVDMTGNALAISGSITNQGKTTAYNVQLNVVAIDITGKNVISITVPLWGNFVNGEDPALIAESNLSGGYSIEPIQSMNWVDVKIICDGTPVSWTVTPIYTTSP